MADTMTTSIMPTYARLPVSFSRGEGVWLLDEQGERYLDALSGIAVCGLGHAHPAVTKAIAEQAGRLVHTSNRCSAKAAWSYPGMIISPGCVTSAIDTIGC